MLVPRQWMIPTISTDMGVMTAMTRPLTVGEIAEDQAVQVPAVAADAVVRNEFFEK